MVQQYIYSRSDAQFVNARSQKVEMGHGFVAYSPGMTPSLKKDAEKYCSSPPKIYLMDSQGGRIPLFRKIRLSKNGSLLLQSSIPIIKKGVREFHVAHGYIIDPVNNDATDPMKWVELPFRLGNPNDEPDGILLDEQENLHFVKGHNIYPLYYAMKPLGLHKEQFTQLLLACFDALANRRQVLLAFDFHMEKALEKQKDILCWIFSLLPYTLRLNIGVDSVYNKRSTPGDIQFAFVDKDSVNEGHPPTIRQENQTIALNGNFLVMDGKIFHADRFPCAWYGRKSLYIDWLAAVVDSLWEKPAAEAVTLISELRIAFKNFHWLLCRDGEEDTLDTKTYDAVCSYIFGLPTLQEVMPQLFSISQRLLANITQDEKHTLQVLFLSRMPGEGQPGVIRELVQDMIRHHTVPASQKDLDLLSTLLAYRKEAPEAAYALNAYLAADVDQPNAKAQEVLQRYMSLFPTEIGRKMTACLFFGELDGEEDRIWKACGVRSGGEDRGRRRGKWYQEKLEGCQSVPALPEYIRKEVSALEGLNPVQQDIMAEGMARTALPEWLSRRAPSPSIQDITAFLQAAKPYDGNQKLWPLYSSIVSDLTDRYKTIPGEVGLETLEKLQQNFAPYAGNARLARCWQRLFRKQADAILQRTPVFPMIQQDLTARLRALTLPADFPADLREDVSRMRLAAYEALLKNPPSFVTGAWMRRELQDLKLSAPAEAVMIMTLVGDFTEQKNVNWKCWRETASRHPDISNAIKFQTVNEIMPRMFLAGALTDTKDGVLIVYFLRKQPSKAKEILLQAVRQGGKTLLIEMLYYSCRYEFQIENTYQTNLTLLLETIATEEFLDQVMAVEHGSLVFDEIVIAFIEKIADDERIGPGKASTLADILFQHYEKNISNNEKKADKKIKSIVTRLRKDAERYGM